MAVQQQRKTPSKYRKAISILNSFRDPEIVTPEQVQEDVRTAIPRMRVLLNKCGISLDDLDDLNIVLIAGTKGKGSTSALTERMLRSLGYKTGLYTGPQMSHTCERFRINGVPISEDTFQRYFSILEDEFQKFSNGDPVKIRRYHKVCTALAFYISLQEKVDVMVCEVHMGGEYCHTNILQNPKVTLITTLDLDHQAILGDTLAKIAWHKAGIFRKRVHGVVAEPEAEAWEVIKERAKEKEVASLSIAPPVEEYEWEKHISHFGLSGKHHHDNISLALQGVRAWLTAMGEDKKYFKTAWIPGEPFEIIPQLCTAVRNVKWPGRNEIIEHGNITFYMDLAHTPKSVQACVTWFQQEVSESQRKRIFVYSLPQRDSASLWDPLKEVVFDNVIFCHYLVDGVWDPDSDLGYRHANVKKDMELFHRDVQRWRETINKDQTPNVLPSARAAMEWLEEAAKVEPLDVLVLGFHVTGAMMHLIDPKLVLRY